MISPLGGEVEGDLAVHQGARREHYFEFFLVDEALKSSSVCA